MPAKDKRSLSPNSSGGSVSSSPPAASSASLGFGSVSGEMITFTFPDGVTRQYPKGVTVGEVLKDYQAPYPVVAAFLDHKLASLERKLTYGGTIEPVHLGLRDGALIYRRSLCFLLIRAIQEIYPDLRVYMNHSLSKGYYVELQRGALQNINHIVATQGDLDKIKARMREIVAADEPFVISGTGASMGNSIHIPVF